MIEEYLSIAGPVEAEIEDRRSRFLAHLEPVPDEAAARAVIESLRRQHHTAGHHCSAFVLGPDGAVERSSDDGEPAGTAGAPMLEVLRGRELRDVVAVVTRWFGGTLLGAGGLVRAYSDAVAAAADAAELVRYRLVDVLELDADYAIAGRVEASLRDRGVQVVEVRHAAQATLVLAVPPAERAAVASAIAELSAGQARPVDAGTRWLT
ncbi:MAG: YigZ family protein [Micropruina sp.]|uniref:YigZ family protein n=1 Tax=Micropruina sp. TaxID=2737536 RepID=UPI0039E5E162